MIFFYIQNEKHFEIVENIKKEKQIFEQRSTEHIIQPVYNHSTLPIHKSTAWVPSLISTGSTALQSIQHPESCYVILIHRKKIDERTNEAKMEPSSSGKSAILKRIFHSQAFLTQAGSHLTKCHCIRGSQSNR